MASERAGNRDHGANLDKTPCPRCSGGGEVLAVGLPYDQKEEGAFAACPDCKGTGFLAAVKEGE